MIVTTQTMQSELMLDGREDWEDQLKYLKETFKEFYLIKFKLIEKRSIRYNKFVFTHEVLVNDNYN